MLLSDEEILRALKVIRHSSNAQRTARMLPSLVGIQDQTGISREHLYKILRGQRPVTENVRRRLSDAFQERNQNDGGKSDV